MKLLLSIAPRHSCIPDGISLCNALTLVAGRCPHLASAWLCRMLRELSAAAAKVRDAWDFQHESILRWHVAKLLVAPVPCPC